jgi:hypothetical protein
MKQLFRTIFLPFVIFIFIISCKSHERKVALVLNDSITLKANQTIPDFCRAVFYFQKDGKQYLFADDRENMTIRIFDLDSRTEIQPIPVSDTGVNAIPYYFGFVVKNLDSIYLPVPEHKLYCINRQGVITRKVDYSSLTQLFPLLSYASSLSRFSKGALIRGEEIFFIQGNSRKYYFSHLPSDYHFLMKYNTKTDSIGISPITLPDDFWKDGKRDMSILFAYNNIKGEFVFGTQYSDRIYTSSDGMSVTQEYRSRSKSVHDYYPYTPPDNLSSEDYFASLYNYSYNIGLVWDPYNEVYYRFVWPGIQEVQKKQTMADHGIQSNFETFVIDILDQDFKTIGTYSMPLNKYNSNHYFVNRDGLYIALNNSAQSNDPDTWVFHRFRLMKSK